MNASLPVKPPSGDDPDSNTMPLLDHITELRKRLMYAIGTMLVAFFVAVPLYKPIYAFIARPLSKAMIAAGGTNQMIYTQLTEAFVTQMKVSAFAALFITFPVIANQIWKFVAP